MCTRTNPERITPVTAVRIFRPTVDWKKRRQVLDVCVAETEELGLAARLVVATAGIWVSVGLVIALGLDCRVRRPVLPAAVRERPPGIGVDASITRRSDDAEGGRYPPE